MAYKFVGYFSKWAQYRQGGGKFFPEQVDPAIYTHQLCLCYIWLKSN
jgi:GH18 family chitinase